jgi:anthranilate synthase/aminodeoxychorismate synthase-like glutamine amidotransferase
MIVLIDNYDSFVFNLARYVTELGHEPCVIRNDAITIAALKRMQPSHIIISPGPCTPLESGISLDVIQQFAATIPILGVCLGHQCIGHVYGGTIHRAKRPMHGKASFITHSSQELFAQLASPLQVARYHSLIVNEENLPAELMVTARCEIGEIMALQHRHYPLYGVQFHPESILTVGGHRLLQNFLTL